MRIQGKQTSKMKIVLLLLAQLYLYSVHAQNYQLKYEYEDGVHYVHCSDLIPIFDVDSNVMSLSMFGNTETHSFMKSNLVAYLSRSQYFSLNLGLRLNEGKLYQLLKDCEIDKYITVPLVIKLDKDHHIVGNCDVAKLKVEKGFIVCHVFISSLEIDVIKKLCTYDIQSLTFQGGSYVIGSSPGSQTAPRYRAMIKLMEQKMNKPGFFGIDGTSSNSNRSYSNRTNSFGKTTNQGSTTTTFPSQATSQTGVSRSQVKDKFKPWNIDGFNGAKGYEPVGLSVGYVSKQWRIESGGQTTKLGHWQDSKQVQGIQAGLVAEPQFKYGLGLFIGIFYEYYYTKDEPWKKDESSQTDKPASNISGENHPVQRTRGSNYKGRDHLKYTQSEHALYIPVRLEYRANFSKDFQLFAYGGLAADIGLGGNYEIYNETADFETISMSGSDIYDNPNLCHGWKSFNLSYEFGGGLRVARHIQLGFTMSKGLLNMSESDNYKVYQDKNLMLTLAVMF